MSIDKVQNVFRQIFLNDELSIFPEMAAKDVPNWDSFNHICLIIALEEDFNLKFTTEEMEGMANVGDLITVLQKHGHDVSWE